MFQAKLCCKSLNVVRLCEIPSFDQQDSIGTSLIFLFRFGWKGFLRVFAYNKKSLQCEAPKIAKLVYNSNNYGLWYANNYSYWGL